MDNTDNSNKYPILSFVSYVFSLKAAWRHALLVALLFRFMEKCSYTLFSLCVFSTIFRLFSCHAFGHRYFSHKSFEVGAWLEGVMALSLCTVELCNFHYWSLMHEHHHLHCDQVDDIHSPSIHGFWKVQFNYNPKTKDQFIKFAGNGKLEKIFSTRYVNDYSWMLPYVNLGLMISESVVWMITGTYLGFYPLELWFWVNFLPRMYTLNALTLTNSAAHKFGSKPYVGNGRPPMGDCNATNCWWAALLNGGEGWHNNHHAFAKSAKHGLMWWEVDWVWWGIYMLGCLGLVWNVTVASNEAIQSCRYKLASNPVTIKYDVLFPSKDKHK